jgi:hypothetical protein
MARINYEEWEERKLSVKNLHLDPQNLRLGSHLTVPSQRTIVAYMFEYEKIMPLARAIALKGYFINETPIVVQEGRHYVVVEGNRRMTACKVLLDPKLAPAKYQPQLRHLASTFDINSLKKMSCAIAPNREDARVIIQNRHTGGNQVEKWDGMKQDRWYLGDLNRGYTIEEIASIYLEIKSKVLASVLRFKLYDEATKIASLSDAAHRFVTRSESFPITTLWRIVASKHTSEFLGLEFTSSGDIELLLPLEEFQKRFAAILEDMAAGEVDSRKQNNDTQIEAYIDRLKASGRFDLSIIPEKKTEASINADELDLDEPSDTDTDTGEDDSEGEDNNGDQAPPVDDEPEPEPTPTPPARPRRRRAPNVLIGGEYTCQTTIPKINEVFGELQTIRLNRPNAVAILFRSLLDLLMTEYVEQKGLADSMKEAQVQEYITANRKVEDRLIKFMKQRHNADVDAADIKRVLNLKEEVPTRWTPSLGFMLKYFDDHADTLIPHSSLREAFRAYTRQQETVTHSEFNLFVHNRYFRPDPAVLTEFWANFAPFVTFLIDAISAEEEIEEDETDDAS